MRVSFKRWSFGVAFMAVMVYAFSTLTGPHGIHALMEKQRLIQETRKQNAIDAKYNERIREHIQRIDDNPAEQEREIREQLKLVRPDEKIFITGPPTKGKSKK